MTIRPHRYGILGRGLLVAALTLTMAGIGARSARAAEPAAAESKGAPGKGKPQAGSPSTPDTSMTLRAGQSGTEFRSMTVEGEDRVHVDFGRPELNLNLDPQDVPGLTLGTALDVLDRTVPDLASPLVGVSSRDRTPYLARPWLRQFATGSVARFRPAVKGAVRWKLLVADSRGETVASFDGKGDPPKEIAWDGRTKSGTPVTPGLTYSYVFEAFDRAGNKRNFVGQGFSVSAYRVESSSGQVLVMSGRDLAPVDRGGYGPSASGTGPEAPAILLEAASWLNQAPKVRDPVQVAVAARTADQATLLANRAITVLGTRVIGDPARIQVIKGVASDAPEEGVLRIGPAK